MAGRRLLDVAALFNASRGIVRQHIALRQQQFDVFTKTSSLAKAVKSQAKRYTETAKAASFLASRMNEDKPSWTYEATESTEAGSTSKDAPIPSASTAETEASQAANLPKEGISQDHFYEKSASNSSTDPAPKDALPIRQEKADRYPLPDGTIPPSGSKIGKEPLIQQPSAESTIPMPHHPDYALTPDEARLLQREYEKQIPSCPVDGKEGHTRDGIVNGFDDDSFYHPSEHTSPVLSSLPRIKIPKHVNSVQANDPHVASTGINSDSYSSAVQTTISPKQEADLLTGEDDVPQGVNTAIFSTARVARSLGGRTHSSAESISNQKLSRTAPEQASSAIASAKSQQNHASSVETKPAEKEDNANVQTPNIIVDADTSKVLYEMRESKVPASRIGRLWNYGGLAAGMFGGAISESLRRATGNGGEGSFMLNAANMDRLVAKLSRMRGAALKMGQMMSFQDSKMLPAPIQEVLLRVQDSADYMPASQRNKVLAADLGEDWRDLFDRFDEKPIAAASIGQVHSAILKSTGERVAVKVQYPGVADSIDSDLSNLAVLLTASRLLPKGLFLDKTIANARTELAWECDYLREAECGRRFQELLADEEDVFIVPRVIPEASGKRVITMEFMDGVGVTKVQGLSQEQKDWIGTNILRLCLREITEFRFMQTDPNWTNFLFNADINKLELLDFGASREYPVEFISKYTQLLNAASKSDKETVRQLSLELGYLTGHESNAMLEAHISSVLTLAEPFLESSPEVYDFKDQTITERVKSLIPLMIKERLAPPPEETYSLHRKLSGAFLLCAKLGSQVRCRELFVTSMKKAGYV